MKSLLNLSASMGAQKPYIAMVIIQILYGGMTLLSKAAIGGGMNHFVFVVYRQAFASLALAPFTYFLERKKVPPPSYSLLCRIFLVALCGMTLSMTLFYFALNYTTATLAAATPNAIPAITFIIAAFLRIESISFKHFYGVAKVFGTVVCLSGALMVALYKGPAVKYMHSSHQTAEVSGPLQSSSKVEWVKGALLMLLSNTTWSLWLIMQGHIITRYPAKIHVAALQCYFSCIQSAVVAIIFERNPSAWKLGWNLQLLSVAYCGVIVSGITYVVQIWCIERKGAVFTSLFTPLALLVTVIFSTILWKESIYWGSVSGALLLVGGLYCVLWGKHKEEVTKNKEEMASEANKQTQEGNKAETVIDCTREP